MVNGSVLVLLRKPVALEEKVEFPLHSPPPALCKYTEDMVFWHQAVICASYLAVRYG